MGGSSVGSLDAEQCWYILVDIVDDIKETAADKPITDQG